MKYSKPAVDRVQLVGRMIYTQSVCEQHGGFWDKGECFPP